LLWSTQIIGVVVVVVVAASARRLPPGDDGVYDGSHFLSLSLSLRARAQLMRIVVLRDAALYKIFPCFLLNPTFIKP
jgi:hypothetical protein